MPWIAPVIAGGMALAGSAKGAAAQNQATEQQLTAYTASVRDLEALGIPSAEAQKIVLEEYRSQGELTPELEESINQGPSAYEGISTDPRFKEAEMEALDELRGIGSSGGMTLRDQANLEKTMGRISSDEKGRRDAALSGMSARGQLGSGLELAARMGGGQDSATARHLAGVESAASASDRALEAIKSAGSLGSSLRGEDFGEQERVASARDKIAAFNAQNAQSTATRNIDRRNDAMRGNLGSRQDIANANVDTRNKQETYNKGLQQTEFANRLDVEKSKASARAGQAQAYGQAGQNAANTWGNVSSGLLKAGTQVGDYLSRDKALEEKKKAGLT